jgi:hypothetical protein
MTVKYLFGTLILIGGVALITPAFAQGKASDMDVASGGGVYSRQDVAQEDAGRMSHPVVGEARAPSETAKGSEAEIERAERAETSKLNVQQ